MVSSASEIYADLDWEASMGGSSGFAGLFVIFVILFTVNGHYLASYMYIPSVMAP